MFASIASLFEQFLTFELVLRVIKNILCDITKIYELVALAVCERYLRLHKFYICEMWNMIYLYKKTFHLGLNLNCAKQKNLLQIVCQVESLYPYSLL